MPSANIHGCGGGSPTTGTREPVTVALGTVPDAPFLRGQQLDVRGSAHQVHCRIPPPAVPHADKVPLAHHIARAWSSDFVCHQCVRSDTLQHLPEQGVPRGTGSLWLPVRGHPCAPLTPAQGRFSHLGDRSVGWQHEQKQQQGGGLGLAPGGN